MFNRREEENATPANNRQNAGNANAPGRGQQGNDPQDGAEQAAQGEGNAQQGPPGQPQGIQMPDVPTIELPRGGGAIQGMGEKFQANPVTGTGSFSVPIAMSPGRGGFTPALALQYDSGNGNSVYGLGWSSSLPSISRKTQRNLPQYHDEVDSDTFLLSGAEDLVPTLKEVSGDWVPDVLDDPSGNYTIKRYRPRIEGLWARIEKWVRKSDGDCHWKSITRDNITTLYGQTPASRITDPDDARKVFQWLIDETYDASGNVMLYEYKQENADGIEVDHLHERNRLQFGKAFTFQYLKKVKYSNRYMRNSTPYNPNANWLFQLVFDYGEHDTANPTPDDNGTWNVRQDPYSTYRAGFEVRTWRLCERILMFHQFDELGPDPVLVKSTNFTYDHNPTVTRLLSVRHWSYEPGQPPASLPPLEFTYTEAERDKTLRQFDVDDMENLPAGLDGQRYTWTDLDGEGISGILVEEQGGWYYKRNFGDEGYYYDYPVNNPPDPDIRFGALETVASKPSLGTTGQLQDMDGDGNLELVVRTPTLSGYFELQQDGEWHTFKAFEQSPNVNWNDPNLRLIDLNGDGIADVLITEDQCLRWFPSLDEKRGHTEARQTARANEEERGPALVFADREQSVYLADMSGDGLTDLVRIMNGSVCYWPNLGYGHFGTKVTLHGSLQFDHPELFDQRRVRLADVDGSGTTDIVYLGAEKVSYWSNRSGNELGLETEITNFPPVDNLNAVQVIDLFGKGTACMVWSSPLPADGPYRIRYIDLMGHKPYLLTQVDNNMGSLQRLHYAPSTQFYLRDRQEGKPWITKLPFPVQVLVRTEVYDQITQARFVSRYAYHHGYFDRYEREFRGFGMVEQWDTEQYEAFSQAGLFQVGSNALDEDSHIPPIHTKTWFHTGFYEDSSVISQQYLSEYFKGDPDYEDWLLADSILPDGLTAREEREAFRALKGQVLRSEVYADDNGPKSHLPYAISEANYELKYIQPGNEHPSAPLRVLTRREAAVFQVIPCEALSMQYERDANDPRIGHQVTLVTDEFGQVTQAASVAYPRRGTGHDAEQLKGYATFSDLTLLNTTADAAAFYRLGAPYQIKHYELTLPSSQFTSRLSKAALLTAIGQATEVDYSVTNATGTKKRLLSSQEVMYWNEDASANLSNGQVASHALPYRVLNQVMTPTMRDEAFNNDGTTRVTESMITGEGLYVKRHGNYWVPNDLLIFDSGNFFRVNQVNHYTGGSTILTYDAYSMMPVSIQDPLSNVSSATCDYRLLQPWETTDPNGNRQQVAFDTLGMVVKTAVMGKAPDHPNLLQDEGDTLSDPTVKMTYDLYQWMNHQAPNFVQMQARETHGGSPVWQTAYTYTSGMGDVALEKVQAEPGDAFQRDGNGDLVLDGNGNPIKAHTATRWIGNGRTVINNKGAAVKQYEPYFSSTHEYEDETEVREYGVTPILMYDPMGRNVRTDHPDGTFTKVAFDAWQQKSYDTVDTVMDVDDQGNWESTWYTDRNAPDPAGPEPSDPDELAAWLSAQHYNTPKIVHLDSLGRSYLTQDDNGTNGNPDFIEVRVELDIEGKQLSVTNDQGQQTDFRYSMRPISQDGSADILYTDSPDGGWRRAFTNISGNPIRAWNERGFAFRNEFDHLLRPTHAWVDEGSGELLVQYTLYGDANGVSGAETYNLRGQVVRAADPSGLSRSVGFDFKGNLLEAETELTADYQNTVDWSILNGITNQFSLDTAAGPLLENIPGTTPFSTTMAYDALNRPTLITQPDGSEHQPSYNEANLLETMDVRLHYEGNFTTYVQNIDYDEKGQRTAIEYGNGSSTSYEYDPNSFRLTRLLTTRNSGNDTLQDLQYTYDAIGNITQLKDDAQQTHFFSNTIIAPVGKYRYDALYRLTQANGREKVSLPMPGNGGYGAPSPIPTGGTAPDTFGNYRETYNYDSLGNILSIGHQDTTVGGTNHWTRYFDYGAAQPHTNLPNNLLQSTHSGTAPSSPDFTYDAHGNMQQMPHLSNMQWDFADQLRATTRGNETTWYVYSGGERTRKVMEDPNGKRYERIYLGGYELYREYDLGGSLQKQRDTHKVMDDQRIIALLEVQTADADGTIDPPDRTTITRYQYTNHLDSASMELDENAGLISYEEYYPFGSTSYQLHTNDSEVSLKRYKYVHKELDEETGLYYYGARYHAPWLCRFVSVDPLKDQYAFQSSYVYAANDPLGYVDVNGEGPGPGGPANTHTVVEGDTYSELAAQYNVSVDQLREWNGYKDTAIPIGAELIVSDPFQDTAPPIQIFDSELRLSFYAERNMLGGDPSYAFIGAGITTEAIRQAGTTATTEAITTTTTTTGSEFGFGTLLKGLGLTIGFVLMPLEAGRGSDRVPQWRPAPEYARPLDDPQPIREPVGEKEDRQQYEYFYRAMSMKELVLTGGLIKHRRDEMGTFKGAGPFITTNVSYLVNPKSFIWKQQKKYDVLVRYKVPKGTRAYLEEVSLKHPMVDITKLAMSSNRPVEKLERTYINFGFPGYSGDLHFNKFIISMAVIPLPDLRP